MEKEKGVQVIDISCRPLILLEAAIGFEPMNNGFADRCLSLLAMPPRKTFESFSQVSFSFWSGKRDLNPRQSRWQREALPAELFPLMCNVFYITSILCQ
jgi:hypothetical protein